jgi:hypothetical protein
MRDTKTDGWFVQNSPGVPIRALRIAAVALAVGFVMMTGAARAQEDDEEDGKSFEDKLIEGIIAGVGGTNMDNRGIDYRERSPLVVPPKLDLPPPAAAASSKAPPNWPKDPDEARRKATIEARKKESKDPMLAARPLMPSELNVAKTAAPVSASNETVQPGNSSNNIMLSPSQLGYSGGLASMFHGNTTETTPFKGEPTRDSLTQPPVGYQTPSPNFAYGTGPKDSLNKEYNPMAGKYGE